MVNLSSNNISDINNIAIKASKATCMDTLRRQTTHLVHNAFKSTSTIFWLINDKGSMVDPMMEEIQNQFVLPYKSYFFHQNPFDPANLTIGKKPSIAMEQLIGLNDFHKTEYYNDFLKPQKIRRQMAIYIRQGGKLQGVIGMHRSSLKSFKKKFLFMGDMISNQLTAAFEKISLLREINKTQDLFKMINENRTIGIILLDEAYKCIFSNTRADQICMQLSKRYVPADSLVSEKCLIPETIIKECRGHTIAPLFFKERVLQVNLWESYRVKYQSLDKNVPGNNKALFMITLEDDQSVVNINRDLLKQKYKLTRRELEVSSYVFKGFTNLQIARVLFISEGTVKNHLKHIFFKTKSTNRTHFIHRALMKKQDLSQQTLV